MTSAPQTPPTPGWMGTQGHVFHVLRTLGATTDNEGRFVIRHGLVATFMGAGGENADCVVDSEAQYNVGGTFVQFDSHVDVQGGSWRGLAAAMNATSYGLRGVTVI